MELLGTDLAFETRARKNGYPYVLGLDEAGRGPLAGPVVAAAVALRETDFTSSIRDSKKLSAAQRERAFQEILLKADVGVGVMNESVIDERNILQASYLAMANAVRDLMARLPSSRRPPAGGILMLVDGHQFRSDLPYAYQTIVGGDARSLSIACASIIAKVTRDRMLAVYAKIFPQYGFARHKGYPTAEHKAAIRRHGLSPIHRKTFRWE